MPHQEIYLELFSKSKKGSLVSWNEVCSSKDERGMGFGSARLMNEALMMKLAYAILRNEDSLWVKILRNKYQCGETGMPIITYKPGSSNIWKGITKIWDKVIQAAFIPHGDVPNSVQWSLTSNGDFTVESAYSFIAGNQPVRNNSIWKIIWRYPICKE